MPALPSVSVIIPAYNEAAVIADAIRSVERETYSFPVEIIIACNGCTDNTAEIARKAKVRVIESQESGMSFGKNLGGKKAAGELLVFLDADSRLLPGTLAKIAACASVGGAVVGTLRAYIDKPTIPERLFMWAANGVQYCRRLPTPSGVIFISRQTYGAIGGFNEKLPQGTSSDLAIRAMRAGGRWRFLWNAAAITSPRRFRKTGMLRQMLSWIHNVRLLRKNKIAHLAQKDYENIR